MCLSSCVRAAVLALASAFVCGCACSGGKKTENKPVPADFPYCRIPSVVADADRNDYYAANYWKNFLSTECSDVADSSFIGGVSKEQVEQAVANYASLLSSLDLGKAQSYFSNLASDLDAYAASHSASCLPLALSDVLDRYFYDANSPVRDEDVYGAFAARMASCSFVPESKRQTYAKDALACSLCQRGTRATNFEFELRSGRRLSLYDIKAPYTVLFFSNPGCHACKDIIDALSSEPLVTKALAEGSLAVMNIYIDEDLAEWYKYMSIYPKEWYNGFDPNHIIRDDELYNIRAIPSLYLLDSDKIVLLKDCPTEKLLFALTQMLS